ncbi:e9imm peptide [Streptomyces incanus]|uniref:E9imm peptide n=1 Tax=Streptomyces incanus TaxID=887453 RepID=A0ABW0XK70_9ACTN
MQRTKQADYASEDEVAHWPAGLDRALGCPYGHVGDVVFRPPERDLSADEVIDQALARRPITQ